MQLLDGKTEAKEVTLCTSTIGQVLAYLFVVVIDIDGKWM